MNLKKNIILLFAILLTSGLSAQTENQGLRVGDKAVDFTMTDQNGKSIQLNELLGKGPVILKWYRGGWCPYCNLELKSFAEHYEAITRQGASLVAISPELPDKADETAAENNVQFSIISDTDNQLGKKYDLVYTLDKATAIRYESSFQLSAYNGNTKAEVPLPATYIVDTDGIIKYAFINTDYKKRADIDDVLNQLSKLTKK